MRPSNKKLRQCDYSCRTAKAMHQTGLTLIELMVSIAIGLLLLAGITVLISKQSATRGELDKATRQIENGRFATQVLQDDLQLAGYYGEYSNLATDLTLPATLPGPCATTVANTDMLFPVQGYDALTTLPAAFAACLPAVNHLAGTDILVIRRTDTASVTNTTTVNGQTYLQAGASKPSSVFSFVLATGTGTSADTTVFNLFQKDGLTPAVLRNFLVHVYFISPCSVPTGSGGTCTASDDKIPTLKRLELVAGGTLSVIPLVEGIENLQLDYGVDYTNDGAPDCYVSDPTAPATAEISACPTSAATYFAASNAQTNWSNVVTIRVNLLARNIETSLGYVDKKTYNLGLAGNTTATNDAIKRHAFSELVRIINPSSRRQ